VAMVVTRIKGFAETSFGIRDFFDNLTIWFAFENCKIR